MSTLGVIHTTRFDYVNPVLASYNELRMQPVSDARQQVRSATIKVRPATWKDEYVDYWGTAVTAFEVLTPHNSLTISAESLVDVLPTFESTADISWGELRRELVLDEFVAFLTPSATTQPTTEVVQLAARLAAGKSVREACIAICLALRDAMEYTPGVTDVHTPASVAWQARVGVCQDMAHLGIGALQSIGVPARYVSGYVYPLAATEIGETVAGESHAWLEFWCGEWIGFDVTNRSAIGTDHVVVARGRDYDDVPPLKGVYAGSAEAELTVRVEVTRLA